MQKIYSKIRLNSRASTTYLIFNFKLKEELIYKQIEILS